MSAIAKLERAKEHLNNLVEHIRDFNDSTPFEIFTEENDKGDLVFRVKVNRNVPGEEWSLLVGDLVHNLRSALDLRISELVQANGVSITRGHAFPFATTAQEYQKISKTRLAGLTPKQCKIVELLKPYQGGNDLLCELHALDILDKHRQLIIAGSAQQSVIIDPTELLRKMKPEWNMSALPVALKPAERDFPLKDGSELYSVKKAARDDGVGEKPSFAFEIAYGDGEESYGEPLVPKMEALTNEVERVLGLLL